MIRRTVRTAVVASACTVVLTTGLAACGTVKQLSAAQKLSDAFNTLGDSKTLSVKLSLDATSAQLVAYGKATGEEIAQKDAGAMAGLGLSATFSADKPLKDVDSFKNAGAQADSSTVLKDTSLDSSFAVTAGSGSVLLEVRQVGAKAYLRADVAGAVKLAGQDPDKVTQMESQLPDSLAPFKDVLAGKWLAVDPKTLQDFGRSASPGGGGATGAAPSAAPSLKPETVKSLQISLKDILTHDVTIVDKGTTNGLDHLSLTAPARRFSGDLLKAFQPVAKEIPSGGKLPTSVPSDIPDRNIALDVALKNGAVASVSFDLAQLDKKAGSDTHLPVTVSFGQDVAPLQAPSGAVELTKEDLSNAMSVVAAMRSANNAGGAPSQATNGS